MSDRLWPPGTCPWQGGLPTVAEDELARCRETGEPLKPWMESFARHNRDKACPDCDGWYQPPMDWGLS